MNTKPHRIVVSGISIAIDRKDIKNLHLGVYPPHGRVRVAAPLLVNDEAIRLAVIGKLGWIKRQRAKFEAQPRQSERQLVAGETHYFLGQALRLAVEDHQGAGRIELKGKKRLTLFVKPLKTAEQREQILQDWYRAQLKEVINELLEKWQTIIGVSPMHWGIRKMKTKWGSCNKASARICFNLELAKKSHQCIEYIVVHELIHLLERHHNERFMTLMDLHLSHWRLLKAELNQGALGHETWSY
jgi:predicted metal-dependent hydrolase